MLEVWRNELRLIVWGVKNAEDPSCIINLEDIRIKKEKK